MKQATPGRTRNKERKLETRKTKEKGKKETDQSEIGQAKQESCVTQQ